MSQTYDGDMNNNGEKVKVCRIDLEIVDTSKLIKPCRVMLERKKSLVHENHVGYFQHVMKLHVKPKTKAENGE